MTRWIPGKHVAGLKPRNIPALSLSNGLRVLRELLFKLFSFQNQCESVKISGEVFSSRGQL